MKKYTNYYMHLIDNRPAYFIGGQICFAGGRSISTKDMVKTLREVRRQQRLSSEYRKGKGWDDLGVASHIIVRVEIVKEK